MPKEVIAGPDLKVDIVDSPRPVPNADQVLIKVVVAAFNPKDWKFTQLRNWTGNPGDDVAGVVEEVGANVTEFRKGDRVAAFHEVGTAHGTFAEYTIAWRHTTFHLPASTTFEEGATIPLAAITSVFGLYKELLLPAPWTPATEPLPLVIYGASTTIGTFAIQLAKRSNIHPIIGIAGASAELVRGLLDESRGDAVVDYRQDEAGILRDVQAALEKAGSAAGGPPLVLRHAYDPASYEGGYLTLSKLLPTSDARLAVVSGSHDYKDLEAARTTPLAYLGRTYAGQAFGEVAADRDLAFVFSQYFARGLEEGWFKAHPHQVIPGGLGGVKQGLADLQAGKAHGVKYVIRVAETEGLGGN